MMLLVYLLVCSFVLSQSEPVLFSEDHLENETNWQIDLPTAKRFLLYSYSAYKNTSLWNWSCQYCVNETAGFVVTNLFYNASTDGFGYAGYNPKYGEIVVAFRGSTSLTNWILNLQFYKSPYPFAGLPAGTIHAGFFDTYMTLQSSVLTAVRTLRNQHPQYALYTTGHSLGGALATLTALDVSAQIGIVPPVITYGCPRVGDSTFVSFVVKRFGPFARVVNANDIVPHIPFMDWDYAHPPSEIWAHQLTLYQCSLTNGEDPSCSDSVPWFLYNADDHLLYLGIKLNGMSIDGFSLKSVLKLQERK